MARKRYSLKNTASLVGLLIALISTLIFGLYIGAVISIITVIIYLIIDKNNSPDACFGALIGFVIGLLAHWILYALNILTFNLF